MARRRGLRRWLRAQQREQAERDEAARPPRAWVEIITDGVFRDVQRWIAAKLTRTPILHVRIVDPPTCDTPRPHPRAEPDDVQPRAVAPRAPVAEPQSDPFGYEAMSLEQLYAASRAQMPGAQRLELERALNRKIKERRNANSDLTPEEHERLSRLYGDIH